MLSTCILFKEFDDTKMHLLIYNRINYLENYIRATEINKIAKD